jgi:hypothetical protein
MYLTSSAEFFEGRRRQYKCTPGTHFGWRLSQPQGHSAAGRIMSMINSNDTIGNQTRDLPACSAVPQPTTPPRAQMMTDIFEVESSTQTIVGHKQPVERDWKYRYVCIVKCMAV